MLTFIYSIFILYIYIYFLEKLKVKYILAGGTIKLVDYNVIDSSSKLLASVANSLTYPSSTS